MGLVPYLVRGVQSAPRRSIVTQRASRGPQTRPQPPKLLDPPLSNFFVEGCTPHIAQGNLDRGSLDEREEERTASAPDEVVEKGSLPQKSEKGSLPLPAAHS